MGTGGEQVDLHSANSLYRIDMQQSAVLTADRCSLGDGLNDARLVVRQHEADKGRHIVTQHRFENVQVHHPIGANRQHDRIEGSDANRVMLDRTD